MSKEDKEALLKIDWLSVRMATIHQTTVSLLTKDGPKLFVFESEADAKAAFDEWLCSDSPEQRLARLKKVVGP